MDTCSQTSRDTVYFPLFPRCTKGPCPVLVHVWHIHTHRRLSLFLCSTIKKIETFLSILDVSTERVSTTQLLSLLLSLPLLHKSYIKAVVSPVRAKCTSLLVRWFLSLAFFPMMSHLPALPSLGSESRAVGELGSNGWDRFVVLLLSLLCGEEGAWSGLRWSGGPC